MFGAVKGAQWPALAVRRYLLYNTLLHEVGHLQVVDKGARSPRRKFADESIAQDLANQWRDELWSRPFNHEDPVHNPPAADETAALARWGEAHAEYKRGLGVESHTARQHFERAVELFPSHSPALTELSSCIVRDAIRKGLDDDTEIEARERAVELLRRALLVDPTSFHANLRMGWNRGHLGHYADARRHIERAFRHGRVSAAGLSALGDAHADWGFLREAEHLFEKALALEPERSRTLLNYACAVWDLGSHAPEETGRALALFERALAAEPNHPRSHFFFAHALATVPGAAARALHHAERALTLRPDDAEISELVARLREPLDPGAMAHLEREVMPTRRFDRKTGDVVEDEPTASE
jgi:tetratricopeptide (TPR) repeat protein